MHEWLFGARGEVKCSLLHSKVNFLMSEDVKMRELVHGLATPISVAQGMLDMALREYSKESPDREKVLRNLEKTRVSIEKMVEIIVKYRPT
jgi:signal transduction histidine kinase